VVRHLTGIPGLNRARVQGWVEQGLVRVNGQPAKASRRLAPGDEVQIVLPPPPPRRELAPEEMPLSVVYEDEWLLALDKPPGLGMPIVGDPLYGAPGWKGIGDPALAELCRDFPRQALHAWRAGLVHPVTREPLEIRAPVPPDLANLLSRAGLTFL
jgi:23S rRNA pseudouridine1911/1915/1917 synthase